MDPAWLTCPRCQQQRLDAPDDPVCPVCRESDREPQGSTVRLFEPAPAVPPGQLAF